MNDNVVYTAVMLDKSMSLEKMRKSIMRGELMLADVNGNVCNVVDVKQKPESFILQELVTNFMVSHPNKSLRDVINPNAVIDKLSETDFIDHALFEESMVELLTIATDDVE